MAGTDTRYLFNIGVYSSLKRKYGAFVRSRQWWKQFREITIAYILITLITLSERLWKRPIVRDDAHRIRQQAQDPRRDRNISSVRVVIEQLA